MAVGEAGDPTLDALLAAFPRAERVLLVTVEAFDWNCPQHITRRYTQAEVEALLQAQRDENRRLGAGGG